MCRIDCLFGEKGERVQLRANAQKKGGVPLLLRDPMVSHHRTCVRLYLSRGVAKLRLLASVGGGIGETGEWYGAPVIMRQHDIQPAYLAVQG